MKITDEVYAVGGGRTGFGNSDASDIRKGFQGIAVKGSCAAD